MKNLELKLKHQNDKTSLVIPIAFDYMVAHHDKPMYDEDGGFCGYKTDHYINVNISKLWDVQRKNNPVHPVSFEMFRCKIESKEKCAQLIESFDLYRKCIGLKSDIVSEGELTFIDKPTKTLVFENDPYLDTVSEMIFKLHNCVPTYMDSETNIIGINTDFVETYVSK